MKASQAKKKILSAAFNTKAKVRKALQSFIDLISVPYEALIPGVPYKPWLPPFKK